MVANNIQFENSLKELSRDFVHWQFLALVNFDGTMIASVANQKGYDLETIGSVGASSLRILEETLREWQEKHIQQILVGSENRVVVLRQITEDIILVVLTNQQVNQAEIQQAIDKIASIAAGS